MRAEICPVALPRMHDRFPAGVLPVATPQGDSMSKIGDLIRIPKSHPHGPGLCKIVAHEDLGSLGLAFKCCHVRPHTCMDGLCESEFYVFAKHLFGKVKR